LEEKDKASGVQNQTDPAARELARELAQLAADRHCSDVVVLDLKDRSPVARYFVIATGTSEQQVRSVAEEMATTGKQKNFPPYNRAGLQQGRWAVVDLVDIVIHLFDAEFRAFYDLELLWGDAPKVAWSRDETD
jgi:ribosome-associated protein